MPGWSLEWGSMLSWGGTRRRLKMKYAVAYRTESDNWIFLKFEPSRNLPYGMFGCGMKMFDDWEGEDG